MDDGELEGKDVALKLVHTADWHLGMTFPSFAAESRLRLTRARLEVVDPHRRVADVRHVIGSGELDESRGRQQCVRLSCSIDADDMVLEPVQQQHRRGDLTQQRPNVDHVHHLEQLPDRRRRRGLALVARFPRPIPRIVRHARHPGRE